MKGITKIASGAEDTNQASIAHFAENGADSKSKVEQHGQDGVALVAISLVKESRDRQEFCRW